MFLPQGGLCSERTVIYLSALRKLAFKQKQIKKMTKDSESPDHRSGVFTVLFSNHKLNTLRSTSGRSILGALELARFDTSKNTFCYCVRQKHKKHLWQYQNPIFPISDLMSCLLCPSESELSRPHQSSHQSQVFNLIPRYCHRPKHHSLRSLKNTCPIVYNQ